MKCNRCPFCEFLHVFDDVDDWVWNLGMGSIAAYAWYLDIRYIILPWLGYA
jgi:hypothetical protein